MKSLQKEEYSAAKAELLSTINLQFTILSILVTTTAAVFVYLFKKDTHQIGLCSCLIIPGIYAFFGILWLDQVYRQRRLAAYIYRIESSDGKDPNGLVTGWEHFIQESRLKKQENRKEYLLCKMVNLWKNTS